MSFGNIRITDRQKNNYNKPQLKNYYNKNEINVIFFFFNFVFINEKYYSQVTLTFNSNSSKALNIFIEIKL